MFSESLSGPNARRRFATGRGIAFEAKPTGDGTWHGYPIAWETVPASIVHTWQDAGKVSRRDLRVLRPTHGSDRHWALKSDVA